MASPNLSEIVTTTLRNRTGQLADNVSNNNALLYKLKERGRIKTKSGGRTIVQELDYQENSTYKRYSGYEVLDISPSDVLTSAEFDWKQAAVAVTMSGLEQLQNNSREQSIDLLEGRITNAERTFMNNLSTDVYSDGTADGGLQMGGMQLLVADDPTSGSVGGIDRATYTFWRNFKYAGVADGGAAVSATNIKAYMNQVWLNTARGTDYADLIVADNNYYDFYWQSLQEIQRLQSTRLGEAGFQTLRYKQAEVVFDGGVGGSCPADHMYFLNTDYIHYCPHANRNVVPMGGDRMNTNQDAIVKLIGWAGNMTLSNGFLQGVMIA